MASKIIQAAGGIVVRKGRRALFAVVQRSKDDAWVLPRGKLKRDEKALAAARREVIEETGHRVTVNEFLGAITYRAGGRAKVVQFWQMDADREPSRELMTDIVAVEWLPLKAAIRRLSYPLEKLFLRHAGASALTHRKRPKSKSKNKTTNKSGKGKKASAAAQKTTQKSSKRAKSGKANLTSGQLSKAKLKKIAKAKKAAAKADKKNRKKHRRGKSLPVAARG